MVMIRFVHFLNRLAKKSDSWSDWISYAGNPIAVGDKEEPKGV
jgi:hypothetical protein